MASSILINSVLCHPWHTLLRCFWNLFLGGLYTSATSALHLTSFGLLSVFYSGWPPIICIHFYTICRLVWWVPPKINLWVNPNIHWSVFHKVARINAQRAAQVKCADLSERGENGRLMDAYRWAYKTQVNWRLMK